MRQLPALFAGFIEQIVAKVRKVKEANVFTLMIDESAKRVDENKIVDSFAIVRSVLLASKETNSICNCSLVLSGLKFDPFGKKISDRAISVLEIAPSPDVSKVVQDIFGEILDTRILVLVVSMVAAVPRLVEITDSLLKEGIELKFLFENILESF